jgi:ribosome biogenesis protein SSF1/2
MWLLEGEQGSYTSGSESEPETDAEVEVLAPVEKKLVSRDKKRKASALEDGERPRDRRGPNVERKAIKLAELGPRMRLRLIKVEEGLCQGRVLWHEFVHKSQEEEREMNAKWEKRTKEKEERKRVQKENLERKRKEQRGRKSDEKAEDQEEDEDEERWDSDMLEAAEELEAQEQAQGEEWEDDEDMEDGE